MSSRAVAFAINQAELADGPWRLLAIMCDVAGPDHDSCWLYVETMMAKTGMGRSTVQRHIRTLHSLGYIVPGDKRLVAHKPAGSRPAVWRINVERGAAGDLRGQVLFELDPESESPSPGPVDNSLRGPSSETSQNWDPSQSTHFRGPRTETHNQEQNSREQQVPASPHERAREVVDIGRPVPGAAAPERALEHIAAARAAIRKETTS